MLTEPRNPHEQDSSEMKQSRKGDEYAAADESMDEGAIRELLTKKQSFFFDS